MSSREPALTQLDRQRFTLCLQRQKGNSETHKIWSSPSFHTHPDVLHRGTHCTRMLVMDTDFDDLIDQVFAGRLLVSVKEAEAAGLGGHSSIYDQISSGDLDAVKDGRSLRIKVSSIRRRLASLPKAIVRPGHTPKSSAS